MRIARLTRRLAAVALLLLVASAAWLFVAQPAWTTAVEQRSEIQTKRELLGRLQTALAEARQTPPASASPVDLTAYFLPGDSDAARGANLQISVSDIATQQGLRLRSSRVLPPQTTGKVLTIGLEANVEASMEQLVELLSNISAHKPYLYVSALRLMAAPNVALGQEQAKKLDVQFEIAAVTGVVP